MAHAVAHLVEGVGALHVHVGALVHCIKLVAGLPRGG